KQLVEPWGVEVGNNVIIDPRIVQSGIAVVSKFEWHQITKDLQAAYFPLARSVSPASNPPSGMTVVSLAKSADVAWGETKMSGTPQLDPEDQRGPLSLAVVVEKSEIQDTPNQESDTKKSTRLVVVGDADFAANQMFQAMNSSGGDFFLNAVNWLAEEEALVSIRPKEPERNYVTLVGSQARFIALTTVVIIPLLVLLSGIFVWWRRR
ncbi:MAG: hypothetical protein QHJ73_09875, partial [Armatimonadota bacterium]|nr:hypothetical protein [Armatimonadota bacterium]